MRQSLLHIAFKNFITKYGRLLRNVALLHNAALQGLSVSMHMYIAHYLAANQKCKNNSQSTFCCLSTCSLCYDNKVESNLIYSEQKWRVHHKTSS